MRDHRGIPIRFIGISRAGGGGVVAGCINVVLDDIGHAPQRQRARIKRGQGSGLADDLFALEQVNEDARIFGCVDASQDFIDQRRGRQSLFVSVMQAADIKRERA